MYFIECKFTLIEQNYILISYEFSGLQHFSNHKPWFDIGILNAIRNRDMHYKILESKPLESIISRFKMRILFYTM